MGRNPLMDVLSPRQMAGNNPLTLLAEFKKFAQGMTPQGAQKQIQQMLSSGQMTQEQFQQLQEQAKDFMRMLGANSRL